MSLSKNILKALVLGAVAISAAGFSGQASATVDRAQTKQMSALAGAVTTGDMDKSYTKVAMGGYLGHRGPRQRRSPHGCDGPPRNCHPI